tara:strand:+ start:3718 stop:4254 length:537 start_codon:yes stop_codon:yes gene_type:complete
VPGIDLVDLNDPLLKKREKNALRLITNPDDEFVDHSDFWYLWTAKEAVFKYHRELTNFTPKEIPIKLQRINNQVLFASKQIEGYFKVTNDVIVAICHGESEDTDFQLITCEDKHQSEKIRRKLEEYLIETYELDCKIISDGDGLPILSSTGQSVSFTHHFHHMAFAFDKKELIKSLPH